MIKFKHKSIVGKAACDGAKAELSAIDPSTRIVMDMDGLENAGSTFLGALLQMYQKVHRAGGKLIMYRPSTALMHPITVLRLDQVFTIKDTLEEAAAEAAD